MVFGVVLLRPIELRASAASGCYRHLLFKTVDQSPSARIDGCGIFKRRFRLRLNALEPIGFAFQKFSNRSAALVLIARLTGQGQIRDAVAAACGARLDMFDLQRHVVLPAIGTGAMPFLQQIFPDFIACEFALLILNATDFRVDHRLQIELDEFNRRLRDRASRRQPVNDGLGIDDS